MASRTYNRILIKISGEALAGGSAMGIDPKMLSKVGVQLVALAASGVQIAVVVGGGNIFRGVAVAASGADRVVGDQMGMLATVINGLALGDAVNGAGGKTRVMSALLMPAIAEMFTARAARKALAEGAIVICTGGTGNPFFTTDTAAALRAVELQCDIMLKATKVDGVYDADPVANPDARRFSTISHDDVIAKNLRIMDTAAFAIARENSLPILVYALDGEGGLSGVLDGTVPSTRIG
ncbi:MAG: UMP kinase [Alphaproteobacteria bacterium]|nr:UMP kinase [Alphaproteobacteria bacterium]